MVITGYDYREASFDAGNYLNSECIVVRVTFISLSVCVNLIFSSIKVSWKQKQKVCKWNSLSMRKNHS